jgi:hypothetical protein
MPADPLASLLDGSNARAILHRIFSGDPLGVEQRCVERLEARAVLMDLERLLLRTMARIARNAALGRREGPLSSWLQLQVDASIEDLMSEDLDADRLNKPVEKPLDSRYAFVCEAYGLRPAKARRFCVVFNTLPDEERHAFYAIGVMGKSFNRFLAEGNGPPAHVMKLLENVTKALSGLLPPGTGLLPKDGPP